MSSKIKNILKSKIKWVGSLLILLAIIVPIIYIQISDKNLHIYFLDVGQGDSTYVRGMNNFDLLIDGGPNNKVTSELGKIMPFWDHKIDYIIATHPHADHLTGLIDVLKRYEIGQILSTDAISTNSEYQEFLRLVKEKNIPFRLVRANDLFNLDDKIKLNILWPNESFYEREISNLNNTSIVAKLTYDNFATLFTGDAESEVQQNLLNYNLKSNILKVAHHGSTNAANKFFISLVKPDLAIFEVGANNKFGHPAQSTLKIYENINSQILRTDINGCVEIISNGQSFWTKIEK